MRLYTDGAHPRTATTVRDAKRFVKIEMTHIGAKSCRPAEADKRVEIRAIHVDLPTCTMHNLAYLANLFFKHSVR